MIAVWSNDRFMADTCCAYLRSVGRAAEVVSTPIPGYGLVLLCVAAPENLDGVDVSSIETPIGLVEVELGEEGWAETCALLLAAAQLDARH